MKRSLELTYLPFGSRPELIIETLEEFGVLILEGFPMVDSTNELVDVASTLGTISKHGLGEQSHRDGIHVHLVQPLEMPRRDPYGNIIKSTSNDAMGCHTDDYFSEEPVELVLLLCCQPAASGQSTLISAKTIIRKLPESYVEILRQPLFPSPHGYRPLLTHEDQRMRYSAYEIEKMVAGGKPVLGEGKKVLKEIENILYRWADIVQLKKGDCIIMHNHKVLHGRTEIKGDEKRLLKRVRLDRMLSHETIKAGEQ